MMVISDSWRYRQREGGVSGVILTTDGKLHRSGIKRKTIGPF